MAMREATKIKRLADLNGKIADIKNEMDADWERTAAVTAGDGSDYATAEEWENAKLVADGKSKRNIERLGKKWENAIKNRDKFVYEHMTRAAPQEAKNNY